MARFEFKLPDIGEGIAEAEIVAWHVKVGERVEEDQQLADMMTDKATVEMESPVAGTVLEVAGDVGDQIAIGSVLVVLETEGGEAAADAKEEAKAEAPTGEEAPLADGLVDTTEGIEEAVPSTEAAEDRRGGDQREGEDRRAEPRKDPDRRQGDRRIVGESGRPADPGEAKGFNPQPDPPVGDRRAVLASPAVRARARDLGIDLG